MSHWWSYSLSDFLLFSPRVYYRLFELHNQALWPAQVLTILLGLTLIYQLVRPTRVGGRLTFLIFGGLWLWIAWSFFWVRYTTINWTAAYVVPFAAFQGIGLIGFGLVTRRPEFIPACNASAFIALGLFTFAVIGYPLLSIGMSRPLSAAEIFGIAPDPTAIATVAVLALAVSGLRWLLMILPALWCFITGLTLWIMEADDFFIAPASALAAIVAAYVRGYPGPLPKQRNNQQ